MDDGQQTMDGVHPYTGKPAGRLKRGNTVNVGRKPDVIRQACANGFDKSIKNLKDIADGKRCVKFLGRDGKVKKRYPQPDEIIKAAETLGKFGIGTKFDVTTGDQPIKAYINVDDTRM